MLKRHSAVRLGALGYKNVGHVMICGWIDVLRFTKIFLKYVCFVLNLLDEHNPPICRTIFWLRESPDKFYLFVNMINFW